MSSPSRSPSPLPPTRYFDLLPTELIRNIFNDLDEIPRSRESEITLLSLCLTSKLFRSLAQPFLLKRIRIQFVGNKPDEAQGKAAQDLLERLVENNSDQSLSAIEVLLFNKQKHRNVVKWLKKLVQKACNLREALVRDEKVALRAFVGSNITKLSIFSLTLTIDYVLFFPELVYLSLNCSPIHKEGGIRIKLPKLRHLGFFWAAYYPQELAFLDQLAPQLVSFTTHFLDEDRIPSSILTSSSISILYEFVFGSVPIEEFGGVRNLWIHPSTNQERLANLILHSTHHLESLTFTKDNGSSRGGGGAVASQSINEYLLPDLVSACLARGVEIVQDEVGNSNTFDDLVPPTFVKRSEARYAKLKAMEVEKEEE